MKTTFVLLLLLLSQMLFPQRLSHSLRAPSVTPERVRTVSAFPDTLRILTIRVQFQTDTDTRTSGNGQFDLSTTTERIIDAPPHDSAYVADHFIFAQNYFSKASNGKQHIATTVLGKVITLKKAMKEYSPVSGNLPLALLAEESWKAADSLYPGFPFQQYDMFAIVHAGVGRDIDLRAALGYDPTPLDLPSLYFSYDALKGLFGPSFTGITLKNSTFKIPNTVVLPETEVRRIPSVGGDFVLKLGINGLIAASIGSHLGLPDLFDTKTGKSGIGRFGLMDGQSIFSFAGICPPEPNAWEKIQLGWSVPIDITSGSSIPAPAAGMHAAGNDTIYRIPISASEYFLVENRFRDVKGDGQTVTMKWNGQTITKTFTKDEDFFSNINIDSAYGVVLNVDELDWSLPGVINANNNFRGGLLVWHIDENIIRNNLAANSVNANPLLRGVDLEEADGSQDIGQSYDFGDPASGSEDGWSFDYWYSGNSYPLYKNEFSETTIPNSLSNTQAHSFVTLKNFSNQSARMTFDVSVGSPDIQLQKIVRRKSVKMDQNDAPTAIDLNGDGKKEMIYTSGDSIYALKDDLTPYFNNTTGLFSTAGGQFQPAQVKMSGLNGSAVVGVSGKTMSIFVPTDANSDGLADTIFTNTNTASFSTPAQSSYSTSSEIIVGDSSGNTLRYSRSSSVPVTSWLTERRKNFYQPVEGLSANGMAFVHDTLRATSFSPPTTQIVFTGKKIRTDVWVVASSDFSGDYLLFRDNTFGFRGNRNGTIQSFFYPVPEPVTGAFAVYDVNGDGGMDYLIGAGDKLYIYNFNGVLLENFPFKTKDGGAVAGSPVIAKKKGSVDVLIFFGTTKGHLYAIDAKGKIVPGFPLQTGGVVSSPLLWNDNLSVASTDSSVYTWKIAGLIDTSKIYWSGFLADESHSSKLTVNLTVNKKSSELLPKKFAYNWPNPVYGSTTTIRYYLGKPASVAIKIVNQAGELVQELKGTSYEGMDNEVQWDVSKIQSGIYFAQITAIGSGEEVSQIVKIAVVK